MYLHANAEGAWRAGVICEDMKKKPLPLHTCMMDLTQMSGAERGESFLFIL